MQSPGSADQDMLKQASAGARRVLDYLARSGTDVSSGPSHSELSGHVADAMQSLAALLEQMEKEHSGQ